MHFNRLLGISEPKEFIQNCKPVIFNSCQKSESLYKSAGFRIQKLTKLIKKNYEKGYPVGAELAYN